MCTYLTQLLGIEINCYIDLYMLGGPFIPICFHAYIYAFMSSFVYVTPLVHIIIYAYRPCSYVFMRLWLYTFLCFYSCMNYPYHYIAPSHILSFTHTHTHLLHILLTNIPKHTLARGLSRSGPFTLGQGCDFLHPTSAILCFGRIGYCCCRYQDPIRT